ncbi:hypothetical protein BH23DEI1_BH23DEI1_03360 [soil metagenome]
MQGFLAEGRFDVSDYLEAYAAEQRRFLQEALDEAAAAGADVTMDDWIFPDWDPSSNHY